MLTPELQTRLSDFGSSIQNIYDTMSTDTERLAAMSALTSAFQQADGTLKGALQVLIDKETTAIGEETGERKTAVAAIVSEINDLAARMADVDRAITDSVSTETAKREAGDARLQGLVDSLTESASNLELRVTKGFADFSTQIALVKESVATVNTRVDNTVQSVADTNTKLDDVAAQLATSDSEQNAAIRDLGTQLATSVAERKAADKATNDSLATLSDKVTANAKAAETATKAVSDKVDQVKNQIDTQITTVLNKVSLDIGNIGVTIDNVVNAQADVNNQVNAAITAILAKPTDLQVSNLIGVVDGRNFDFTLPSMADVTRPYFLEFNGVGIYEGEDYEVDGKNAYHITTVSSPDPGDKMKVKFYAKSYDTLKLEEKV